MATPVVSHAALCGIPMNTFESGLVLYLFIASFKEKVHEKYKLVK